MTRFQRLSALLHLLSQTPGVSVLDLAREFEIDRRTIQRDLRYLRSCGHSIQETSDKIPHYYLERQDIPEATRPFLWCWSADFLPQLGQALLDRRRLRIRYRGDHSLRSDWLEVEPRQVFFERFWQLRAYLPPVQRYRVFRLDRNSAWEVLSDQFRAFPSEDLTDWHHWDRQGGTALEVACQVSQTLALQLRDQPVHPSQQLRGNLLRLRVRDIEALLDWMLAQNYCRVLEPEWLRLRFQERVALLQT